MCEEKLDELNVSARPNAVHLVDVYDVYQSKFNFRCLVLSKKFLAKKWTKVDQTGSYGLSIWGGVSMDRVSDRPIQTNVTLWKNRLIFYNKFIY